MNNLNAQISNLHFKRIPVKQEALVIDSLSLIPNSIRMQGYDTSFYHVDAFKSTITWNKTIEKDSVDIQYRTFPINLTKKYFHKNIDILERNIASTPYYYDAIEAANTNKTFIDFGTVDYSGSFGRALSFGNSQDVVLNSQFNLQLDGDLGDSIKLTGAITDNTIPFQPEGNTQQLQEFDKVFLQLKRKKSSLIVGDHNLVKPNGYFLNYYKRVQGGLVSSTFKTSDKGENRVTFGASLAKGKFVRNVLTALEGNQGPYKLTGPNGEQFFIVLAGSERVYIDGIQLQRGEDRDYTIDYNTAEVVFMPRRIITKDLRIVVEFEFSDRNFLNSLFILNDEWQVNNKLQLRMNIYSNQDAKNQPVIQTLDSSQKRFLAEIGDSILQAYYPSVRFQDTFSNSLILYKKIDTLVNSTLYSNVYEFSTNPDSAKYYLSFSSVGMGKGNYIQSINSANGRVYAWQAPINNIPQGEYEPIIVLVTPKKQQIITAGATYHIDSMKSLMVETALSNYDPNTFSPIDNNTHLGLAAKLIYDEKRSFTSNKNVFLNSKINYEFVQNRFRGIERFRNVEFARDWNFNQNDIPQNEHLGNAKFVLSRNNLGAIDYTFGTYSRGNDFKGFQNIISISGIKKGFRLLARGDWMNQNSNVSSSNFFRPYLEFEKMFSKLNNFIVGTKVLIDHNDLRNAKRDSLLATAFSFDAITFYAKNNQASKNTVSADYTLRHDRAVKNNAFAQSTLGNTFSLNTSINSLKNQEIKLTSAYRILDITDSTITALKPDESLLGRLEYNFTFIKGLVAGNMLYEFGSGQEAKREFTYVEVPIGQGIYVWRDYNNDNLKQLNEFELAVFPDEKKYIKVFTPTNQYVKAKYSIYNQSISINPKVIYNSTKLKGFKKVASIFYLQSSLQLNNRFIGTQGIVQYNPFINSFDDSLLINNASSIVNSIFINRFSNKWGSEYINTLTTGKTLLNYGIDGRKNVEHQLRLRFNISKNITLGTTGKTGSKAFTSQFLETRSYIFNYQSIEPNTTLLLKRNSIRITGSYKYDVRKNEVRFGGEEAKINNVSLDMKYNIVSSGSVSLKTTFSEIKFDGNSNSTIGYTMLDGLLNGKNWLWQAGFEKRISRNIEMSLEYEGRKPASNSVIHTGRASVRAIF